MPGAIEEFDLVRFGGPTIPVESNVAVGLTATELISDDPDRLSVTVTNTGAFEMRWSTSPRLTLAASQILGVGQTFVLQVQNDGRLTGYRLWIMSPGGAGTANVLILRRQHPG